MTQGEVASRDWRAIGTSVHVLVTDGRWLGPVADTVAHLLDEVDLAYSRFRPDSELRRLEPSADRPARVSPLLGRAIETALRAARLTDGAVDPTVGASLRRIGYDDDFAALAGRDAPLRLRIRPIPGWQVVRYEPVTRALTVPAGVELDFGSTGKALAADLAVEAALGVIDAGAANASHGPGVGVLVSLGGDIATGGPAPEGGWRILAAEDSEERPDARGEVIAIESGALATSSTTVRRWTRDGITLHHLVDPATGLPVDGPWRTASVVAATCVDANAAATAAIVKGMGAVEWLARQSLPARLISQTGEVVRLGGWPEPASWLAVGRGAGRAVRRERCGGRSNR